MKDIGINESGKIGIVESDNFHIQDILILKKGWLKFSPKTGEDIERLINEDNPSIVLYEAKEGIKRDGAKVNEFGFLPNGKLRVNATYNR